MLNSLDSTCIKFMMKVSSSDDQDFMNCNSTSHLSATVLAVYIQLYIQAENSAHCIQLKIWTIVQFNIFRSLK